MPVIGVPLKRVDALRCLSFKGGWPVSNPLSVENLGEGVLRVKGSLLNAFVYVRTTLIVYELKPSKPSLTYDSALPKP